MQRETILLNPGKGVGVLNFGKRRLVARKGPENCVFGPPALLKVL